MKDILDFHARFTELLERAAHPRRRRDELGARVGWCIVCTRPLAWPVDQRHRFRSCSGVAHFVPRTPPAEAGRPA